MHYIEINKTVNCEIFSVQLSYTIFIFVNENCEGNIGSYTLLSFWNNETINKGLL